MAEIATIGFARAFEAESLFARATSPEGSLAWFRCLAETTLAQGEEAVLAVARDAKGETRAALPLAKMPEGGVRALTAPYTTLYAPALPDAEYAHALGAQAAQFVPDFLRLDALDLENPGVARFADGLARSGLSAARYRHFANWFEEIADFETYWSARPSRLRTTVKRKLAQAAKSGACAFHCVRLAAELDAAAADYEDIYRASWKEPEPHADFIMRMVSALGAEGLVRIGLMKQNGRAIAAQIWLVCGRKATIFKLAHREDAIALSPGTLLTEWMASVLCRDDRLEEIDFGRGDDGYKRDWLSRKRWRYGLVAANWQSSRGRRVILREVVPTRLKPLRRWAMRAAGKRLDAEPSFSGNSDG